MRCTVHVSVKTADDRVGVHLMLTQPLDLPFGPTLGMSIELEPPEERGVELAPELTLDEVSYSVRRDEWRAHATIQVETARGVLLRTAQCLAFIKDLGVMDVCGLEVGAEYQVRGWTHVVSDIEDTALHELLELLEEEPGKRPGEGLSLLPRDAPNPIYPIGRVAEVLGIDPAELLTAR
jgi:hypothetical protein